MSKYKNHNLCTHTICRCCQNLHKKRYAAHTCPGTLKVMRLDVFISNPGDALQSQAITCSFLAGFWARIDISRSALCSNHYLLRLICKHRDWLTHTLPILWEPPHTCAHFRKHTKSFPLKCIHIGSILHSTHSLFIPLTLFFSFSPFSSPTLPLSHASPRTSGWASLTAQYRNGPFSLPFFSSLCLPAAVGWELTANKKSSLFLVPKNQKKGTDPFCVEWFVFPPFCVLCWRFWPLLVWS